MEDWGFVESRFEELDADLMQAKNSPFKVRREFDHRFDVWVNIGHRNRRIHLEALRYDPAEQEDLTKRYVSLDLYDLARLARRAKKEFLYAADDVRLSNYTLIMFKNLFHHRISELIEETKRQLLSYERITGLDIISKFTNGYTEIGGETDGGNTD